MSLSDDLRRMADRATELERECEHARTIGPALDKANEYVAELEEECAQLEIERDELSDRVSTLGRLAGLSEQARKALEMASTYLAEGDDIATSQRLQDTLLQAVASCREAKEAA